MDQPLHGQVHIVPGDLAKFSLAGRSVFRLYRSHEAEILMVCWEPGQQSSTHDHGPSESIVFVLQGSLKANPGGRRVAEGEMIIAPRGVVHQLVNDSSARAVSLHLYSPPLSTPISLPFEDLTESDKGF
jgi:quercetin dioxygenase-like cupin family protein